MKIHAYAIKVQNNYYCFLQAEVCMHMDELNPHKILCGNPRMYMLVKVPFDKSNNKLCTLVIGLEDRDDYDVYMCFEYYDEDSLRKDAHELISYMKDLEGANLSSYNYSDLINLLPDWLSGKETYRYLY